MRDKTEVAEDLPTLKTDDQGNLIPAEALIGILLSIIENPIEIEDFKKTYLEDPRLEDWEDDPRFKKDNQGIILYNRRTYIPTKHKLNTTHREHKLPASGEH